MEVSKQREMQRVYKMDGQPRLRTAAGEVRKALVRKGITTSAQDKSVKTTVLDPEEVPMVALNNTSFQEAGPQQHPSRRKQSTSTTK